MSDLPQQTTIRQYVLDGIQIEFAVPFFVPIDVLEGSPALDVYLTPAGQPPIPELNILTWPTDFTYTPLMDPISGGTLVLLATQAAGDVLTIIRNVPASLDVEFSNASTFSGQNLDDALDKLLLIEQQNKTYAFQRNISYIANALLPDADLQNQVQIPVLGVNEIWIGTGTAVISAVLEQNPDVSTLRSELANNSPGTAGARLVGYYDSLNSNPTTVDDQLTYLTAIPQPIPTSYVPTGAIIDFGGVVVPDGFLLCNGDPHPRASYPALVQAITFTQTGTTTSSSAIVTGLSSTVNMYVGMGIEGSNFTSTTIHSIDSSTQITLEISASVSGSATITFFPWGNGDGSTSFSVPGSQRKVSVGSGDLGTSVLGNKVGQSGGSETHTMITSEMPSHTHSYTVTQGTPGIIAGGGSAIGTTGSVTGSTGGGVAFTIMQPSMVVLRIIKT